MFQYLIQMLDPFIFYQINKKSEMLGRRSMKKSFMRYINADSYKILKFSFYILIIFACHMTTAVLIQKVYKTPYIRNESTANSEPKSDYFSNPFGIPIFNSTFALFYGIFMYQILHHNSSYTEQAVENKKITIEFVKLSVVDLVTNVVIGLVIILTSFTMVNLINCCKLLAVVLFAVFFGKADGHFKIGKKDILVAVLVCIGILVFNLFANASHDGVDKQFGLWTGALMLLVLMLQGYRPQLISQIRAEHSPPPSYMYYQVSKYTLLFLLLTSLLTTQLFSLISFLWSHDRLSLDLTLIAVLEVTGNTFIYRLAVSHKQHIVPLIATIRKLCTSIFNIYYFKHSVNAIQFVGVGIVALAIIIDFLLKGFQNRREFKQVQNNQEQDVIGVISHL